MVHTTKAIFFFIHNEVKSFLMKFFSFYCTSFITNYLSNFVLMLHDFLEKCMNIWMLLQKIRLQIALPLIPLDSPWIHTYLLVIRWKNKIFSDFSQNRKIVKQIVTFFGPHSLFAQHWKSKYISSTRMSSVSMCLFVQVEDFWGP